MKNRLTWCAGAKNGISLSIPNDDLTAAYLRKSEEAMEAMHSVASRDWKISAGYYSLYFSLYSVLMKIGIKSGNHVCTIETAPPGVLFNNCKQGGDNYCIEKGVCYMPFVPVFHLFSPRFCSQLPFINEFPFGSAEILQSSK